MKSVLNIFTEYLAESSLKDTPQRRKILTHFMETKNHFSAEEFYHSLHDKGVKVGQATVYRTLKLLSDAGIAKEVNFGDGITRFEVDYGNDHHDHLICENCHANVEIVSEKIEKLQEMMARQYGYTLRSHRLYLYGLCPKCQIKPNN